MLDIIASSLLGLLLEIFRDPAKKPEALELISWHDAAIFELPESESGSMVQQIVDEYLDSLSQQGMNKNSQGVWLQSDWFELGEHQSNIPLPAASLTKIATTLAVVGKLGIEHRFVTGIYHTGSIREGILEGDLIIEGNGDPFFVWEEAIALSNALNQLGIREIEGNLLVNEQFYMNYKSDSFASGKLLKQGLNSSLWSAEVKQQFQTLPLTTPRPQLAIKGEVKVIKNIPPNAQLLLLHQSLPLADILRQMNIYSNNKMAQMLADTVGGASAVASYGIETTGVSTSEIQLINGSGLGEENRISPRAATKMLIAIDRLLQPNNLDVMDIFPVAGRDRLGTIEGRQLPQGVAIKTGTLNQVSALAGLIAIDDKRRVWFTVVNNGWQIEKFRQQQDELLQKLARHWQLASNLEGQSFPTTQVYLGDPKRNQIHQTGMRDEG